MASVSGSKAFSLVLTVSAKGNGKRMHISCSKGQNLKSGLSHVCLRLSLGLQYVVIRAGHGFSRALLLDTCRNTVFSRFIRLALLAGISMSCSDISHSQMRALGVGVPLDKSFCFSVSLSLSLSILVSFSALNM